MKGAVEAFDSLITLDNLVKESVDMNNFLNLQKEDNSCQSLKNFFSDKINLKNAIQNQCWERNEISDNTFVIKILDVIPQFQISNKLISSIYNYIFSEGKDVFIGKINTTRIDKKYYDIIESPSFNKKDCNLLMIPKLILNDNNKSDFNKIFKEVLEAAFNKLNPINICNNNLTDFYHNIFYFYRSTNEIENKKLTIKIYTIFPNINFSFKQIKNLSLSNTNLNKYLISNKFKCPEITNEEEYNDGFFTMSQNHRLIALKNDIEEFKSANKSKTLKEIIFGIWINLKKEKPSAKKTDLDSLFNKYKNLIFKKCLQFLLLTNNIETIYSPSPEEGVFILVLFYSGVQCHYEVKYDLNNDYNLKNYENNWLISKFKFELDEKYFEIPFDFDMKMKINDEIRDIQLMNDYLNKKIKNKQKNNENINLKNLDKNNKEIKTLDDSLSDVFDISEFDDEQIYKEYNYPLATKNNNEKINLNIMNIKNNSSEVYHESTNYYSNKVIALDSSKNSGNKNNNDDIKKNSLISEQISSIMKNSESIKNLQEHVDKLENNIKDILTQLENKSKTKRKKENKKNKMKIKNKEKEEDDKNDISKKADIKNKKDTKNELNKKPGFETTSINTSVNTSIKIPHIVYKELSITNDEI